MNSPADAVMIDVKEKARLAAITSGQYCRHSARARLDLVRFYKLVIFNFALGNADFDIATKDGLAATKVDVGRCQVE